MSQKAGGLYPTIERPAPAGNLGGNAETFRPITGGMEGCFYVRGNRSIMKNQTAASRGKQEELS